MHVLQARRTRRWTAGWAVTAVVATTLALALTHAQEQAPERKDLTIVAKDYAFSPARLDVGLNDLVRLTVRSEDVAYGFAIDEYRVSKRVPPGGAVTFEFRADRSGVFTFYSSLTNDARHSKAKGQLIVAAR